MRWKVSTIALLTLLLGTNLWHFYVRLNNDVSRHYRDQVRYELANQIISTAKLCGVAVQGKGGNEIIALLKTHFPEEVPFNKEGAINIDWLHISLDADGRALACEVDGLAREWADPV
jgi:hypothetical protein